MSANETARSIRFPQSLWDAIDRDAIRCRRSSVKQMEAVLMEFYGLENVRLNLTKMAEMHGGVPVAPNSQKTIPLVNSEQPSKRKVNKK